jgi:hypothetical protein
MATILNGDIQVDYLADNRQKRLSWLGGTNPTYTMNEIYSAMATLLDETTTIDDGTCFSAETPVEYTIGKIDTGDTEPWYITFDLMEHVTGGALRTSGWARVVDTNAGILVVPVASGGTIVAADEGYDVTHADGDAGTLLEFIDTGGSSDYLVIRPDTSAAANDFSTSAGVITSARGAFTATQNAASTTGEQIWANLYSLGTIDSNVHLYAYQGAVATDGDRVRLTSWNDATQDWYGNSHIDICIALKDITASTWSIIDAGYITIFGRKYGDLYASFEVACSTTSGGRNPIPLQTASDLDNTTGILTETFDGTNYGAGWAVGDIMSGDTSGARGIITAITTPGSTQTVDFIPIDDPLGVSSAWTSGEDVTSDGGGTGAFTDLPSDTGPAASSWFTNTTTPTIAFTYVEADIDDDSTNESYAIAIDCKSNPLTEVYEWIKYATRNGETANDLDGINGESYIGGEVYLSWTGAISGTMSEGSDVTQATSGATGVIVAIDATAKLMLLRDTRGTFSTSYVVTDNDQSGTVTPDDAAVTFAPKTASPLGTFAGGTFFGARGVLLTNYLAADANSFILTPIEGGTKERPASITIAVSNLVGGVATSNLHDRVSVFRLTGAGTDINKTEYTCDGGEAVGANTITVGGSIAQDVPGKVDGGTLVLVDDSDGGAEYKLRFTSWTGSIFTLNEITGTATAGTGDTTLVDSGATFTDGADQVFRGDLVIVAGKGSAHVKTVDSDTQLTLESPGISGFVTTDAYELNTCPVLLTSSDKVYVPFMDRIALSAEESVSITYASQIYYRAKVRNTRAATKIKPFSVDGSSSGSDVSVATIRTEDTIIN